jgi:hypothetical protein
LTSTAESRAQGKTETARRSDSRRMEKNVAFMGGGGKT